ncbi:MAG: hypothetical protein Q4C02_10660, partial [Eubacteriales bacterium]|nr:hypothetical protein [Eubacteriales bacterium]
MNAAKNACDSFALPHKNYHTRKSIIITEIDRRKHFCYPHQLHAAAASPPGTGAGIFRRYSRPL